MNNVTASCCSDMSHHQFVTHILDIEARSTNYTVVCDEHPFRRAGSPTGVEDECNVFSRVDFNIDVWVVLMVCISEAGDGNTTVVFPSHKYSLEYRT